MRRKIAAGALIGISSLALAASLVGIALAWMYNEPLTEKALAALGGVDSELRQTQAALTTFETELTRALQTVNETEQALRQSNPESFLESVQTTLNDELLPELATARERLVSARDTLQDVRVVVFGLNIVPFVKVNIPDQMLTDLIDSADALESQITDVGDLAEQASVLLNDASQLFGGNLEESRASLQGFLADVESYQEKVQGWRERAAYVKESLPLWMDLASTFLTLFLFWFGLSQVSLLLHGRAILRGENPWEGLRSLLPFRRAP